MNLIFRENEFQTKKKKEFKLNRTASKKKNFVENIEL